MTLSLIVARSAAGQEPVSFAPPDWDAEVRLASPADRNPDPHIVEVDLTARVAEVAVAPDRRVQAWTYDGGLPGPLIRATAGDRLIVHFRNQLPQPTTVHWHGVRVPIGMDGVPGISQPEVKPGESFVYDFVVRDPGLFWYHPHVMSAAQVGFGLYGALLVEDPAERTTVGVADEVTLVLSDLAADNRGVLEPADSGGSAGMVFGREGAYVLVNGKVRPRIRARAGAPQRWRVVNAAKSRYFYLDLEAQPMQQIGGDGGLQEYAVTRDLVLVAPGERVDLVVTPRGAPGTSLTLRSLLYNRGYGSTEFRVPEDLLTVDLSDAPPLADRPAAVVSRALAPPAAEGAKPLELVLTLPPIDEQGHNEFRVNDVPFWKARPYRAAVGETQLWTVRNDTEWDHPFHLHGFFFTVLDEKNQPVRPLAWKDTVNIPMKTTVRLLVSFDERPGEWMFHCHILDHADGGLMGTVLVGDGEPSAHVHTHTP
ncbi:MAG TPA: multicopper oxidase family protein [Vicinamibacterales bacterium]|nr:multicopper oxidase family protein [Vicinamibacterales bacterium]